RLHGTHRSQEAKRDRKVETDAFLPDVRGGEVDSDTFQRERVARVPDGRADPLSALPDSGVRQPDRREHGQPLTHVDLDADQRRLHARETGGEYSCQHQPPRRGEERVPTDGRLARCVTSTRQAGARPGPTGPRGSLRTYMIFSVFLSFLDGVEIIRG